ncbi:protein DEHYDRATION-INDUCED 19 homolog 4-like isoform X2 [Malania oleifera]|uniref:protein DEHYDRATION-INDUCED 19 homolog 4-like isoform X2 n=1 Tax=Malania oleifera TaxID=397392 RepID=UPI0025AE924E|nr:protein DEHYDRATION-INDUCED 19 homolog 4-like isoform X2 [Malania oleifera]
MSMEDYFLDCGLSTSSKGQHLVGYDHCFEFEEIEDDEEEFEVDSSKAEYPCPFCTEDFDIVGLCCHIDKEHPVEAESGVLLPLSVCPFCTLRVGMNLVGHITSQHGDFFKKLKLLKGEAFSTLQLPKKDALDGHLWSSHMVSSSSLEPDPLLFSFIHNLTTIDESKSVRHEFLAEANLAGKSSNLNMPQRDVNPCAALDGGPASSSSDEDYREKAVRSEFVQGLLWSTMLDDSL